MKTALKISAVILALSGHHIAALAQSAVDGSKLPGVWNCAVSIPVNASGTTKVIRGHATYNPNGTVVHEDRIIQTSSEGKPVEVNLIGLSDWSFSKESNRLYETLRKVDLQFDKTNPQAALMGVQMDRNYQTVVGKKQVSTVVRLNDKEWTSLLVNDTLAVMCERGQ
ncbi:hypothetical protein DTO96_100723 [Ephemeroptericola cinctiostellae]|uniref:Uncharacterized protein n=1 Tax=Ephemeroptericola cinctiostellae TaxID=2268024 RepID=A0A345D9G8_9BURK|nr:hypothetical protein [Ephemeroptericola cinctiostellae]AXF85006.1 hypothetical protein DTO96_100723 [Ephemeroptericola cinctiostellae]